MENKAISIKQILESDYYVIPRYQRNYAWRKKEISQLIKDVDEFLKDRENKSYYLGILVCFRKEDGSFELIDGQQRHTTITLINLVLYKWKALGNAAKFVISEPNIKFDSRKKSENYIENLYRAKIEEFNNKVLESNIAETGTFKDAIEIIREELMNIDKTGVGYLEKFVENFYNRVYLFRVEVPEDTDLNHYFEIMNNRGEQLEKHEIVKALLMSKISNDNNEAKIKEQETFAAIWDACSDMNDYVYFNFDPTTRNKLLGIKDDVLKGIGFANIAEQINVETENDEEKTEKTLGIILKEPVNYGNSSDKSNPAKEKYKSIIDFPNFLLQILALENSDVSLDDKNLLQNFNKVENIDPKKFITDLLKYRIIFDKYIIKQDLSDADDKKQNWGIKKLKKEQDNKDEYYLVNTLENDDELVKLQVMLYYSDSTNTRNYWLQEILKGKYFEKDVNEYTKLLFEHSKEKFKKHREKLCYSEITIFNLYFIDFLLWKLYKEETVPEDLQLLKDKINKNRDLFKNFKFTQISSREHLLPQDEASDSHKKEICNGIGNLCLISTSQNSEGNNKSPIFKKERFKEDKTSLKRIIMFESFDEKWEEEQIKNHGKEIELLIKKYLDS